MAGMAEAPVPDLFNGPAEIRLKIYGDVLEDAGLMVFGNGPIAINEQLCGGTPRPSAKGNIDASQLPWQLAATCTKIRKEFLPLLRSAIMLYYHKDGEGVFDLTQVLPFVYIGGIQHLRMMYSDHLTLRLSDLPALETVEIKLPAIEWTPQSKCEVHIAFDGIAKNAGLLALSRRNIRAGLPEGLDAAWLDDPSLPANVDFIVSAVVWACLPSKREMLDIRGLDRVPDKDDADVTFEVLYNWRSGAIMDGQRQLEEAREILLERFNYDAKVQEMLEAVTGDSSASEMQVDEWEWEIEQWNDREGELLIAPGREWAFAGAVKMTC